MVCHLYTGRGMVPNFSKLDMLLWSLVTNVQKLRYSRLGPVNHKYVISSKNSLKTHYNTAYVHLPTA